jgi:hypothetical protein
LYLVKLSTWSLIIISRTIFFIQKTLGKIFPVLTFEGALALKIVKTRGHFPTDDAATKLFWLGLRNITANWDHAAHDWKSAMNQFATCTGIDLLGLPGE